MFWIVQIFPWHARNDINCLHTFLNLLSIISDMINSDPGTAYFDLSKSTYLC